MPLHHPAHENSTNGRTLTRSAFAGLSRLAPPLAARLAERVFLTPQRPRRPVRETAWLDGSSELRVPSPDGMLAARVWGAGPEAVLLVHGWSGRGTQLGAFVRPLVDAGFRVVAWDAPGHGESPGGISSMPQMAAAVAAVAGVVGEVHGLVAHSLGAAASLLALDRLQVEPVRVAFIAPPADYHAIGERFGAMTGFSAPVVSAMRRRIEQRFDFSWSASAPLRLAARQRTGLLVVHDTADRHIPWSEGAAIAEAWPDAELYSTTGLGHHRVLRDPEVVHRVVEHITSCRPESGPPLLQRVATPSRSEKHVGEGRA